MDVFGDLNLQKRVVSPLMSIINLGNCQQTLGFNFLLPTLHWKSLCRRIPNQCGLHQKS